MKHLKLYTNFAFCIGISYMDYVLKILFFFFQLKRYFVDFQKELIDPNHQASYYSLSEMANAGFQLKYK